jgi:hypothetical protein
MCMFTYTKLFAFVSLKMPVYLDSCYTKEGWRGDPFGSPMFWDCPPLSLLNYKLMDI